MAFMQTNTGSRKQVLDYPVDLVNKREALEIIANCWQTNGYMHVVTINAEMVIAGQANKKLSAIVHQANLVIPDGAGIIFALKLQGCRISRLPGIELARASLQQAADKNISVALVGSSPEVLSYLEHILPKEIPGLKLVFCQDGYFNPDEEDAIMEKINNLRAQLVLVAMGIPRQEYFIEKALKITRHTVFIGVGGSFDVWAGKKQRAPQIWQTCHLEWLYRLLKEPWRFKRMASTLPNFACQVLIKYVQNKLITFKKDKT